MYDDYMEDYTNIDYVSYEENALYHDYEYHQPYEYYHPNQYYQEHQAYNPYESLGMTCPFMDPKLMECIKLCMSRCR